MTVTRSHLPASWSRRAGDPDSETSGGRLVTLGGRSGATPFEALGREWLSKELEIMGSRYCTRQEVQETLELAARGDICPLVTEKCLFDAKTALTIHERLEQGDVLGRAALMIREEEPGAE